LIYLAITSALSLWKIWRF